MFPSFHETFAPEVIVSQSEQLLRRVEDLTAEEKLAAEDRRCVVEDDPRSASSKGSTCSTEIPTGHIWSHVDFFFQNWLHHSKVRDKLTSPAQNGLALGNCWPLPLN